MKRQRLFVHVGPHKTGTSSFQSAIAGCAGALRDSGLAVWLNNKGGANAGQLVNLVTRPELQTPFRLQGRTATITDDRRTRAARRLTRWAMAAPDDLLISGEAFSHLRTDQEAGWLRALLPASVRQIVPILVRRPLEDWRASRRDQLQKFDLLDRLDALPNDTLSCNGAWYYDWTALEAFWAGFGTPVVVDYARAVADEGSVLPVLARVLERPGCLDGVDGLWLNRRSG